MDRARIALQLSVWLIMAAVGMFEYSGYAASSEHGEQAALVIRILYPDNIEALKKYEPHLELSLLADDDDILGQITALQEQSKPALEPLVKHYMHAAETLNRSSAGTVDSPQQRAQLIRNFTTAETRIQEVLERYTPIITEILQRHARQKIRRTPLLTNTLTVQDLPPGRYRIYGVLTYATTTLTWFEPVYLQGGDCRTITFTRDNLNNPYWTTLNWWSFLNLDFSKHH